MLVSLRLKDKEHLLTAFSPNIHKEKTTIGEVGSSGSAPRGAGNTVDQNPMQPQQRLGFEYEVL